MEELKVSKRITIELDLVNGEVTFDNPDGLTDFEVIGLLEWAKMMLYQDMQE